MYKQKNNEDIVVHRNIVTRRHDAVIYETCRPEIEKYKKGASYRGIQEWNNLSAATRNIATYEEFKSNQKTWMMHMTLLDR